MSVCSKFSQLCFCQTLFELVYRWESYHNNNYKTWQLRMHCNLRPPVLLRFNYDAHAMAHAKFKSLNLPVSVL